MGNTVFSLGRSRWTQAGHWLGVWPPDGLRGFEGVARERVKLQAVGPRPGENKVHWGGAAGWGHRKRQDKFLEPNEPQVCRGRG